MLRFLPFLRLRYDMWLIMDFRTADSYVLTFTPLLLDGRRLLCTITYSAMTRSFVLVFRLFGRVVLIPMYISTLLDALETPSEFSSVPILVADELAHSSSCETRS